MYYFLRGGLGNQLFIVGKSLLDERAIVDTVSGFKLDRRYKRQKEYHLLFDELLLTEPKIKVPSFFVRYLIRKYDNSNFLCYSLKYYQRTSMLVPLSRMYKVNCINRMTVHLRFLDYNLSYNREFEKALIGIVSNYSGSRYLITDDLNLAQEIFPNLCKDLVFVNDSSINSWKFIACSSDVITSDSSFSLTAAFLGCKKNIYHPSFTNIIVDEILDHSWMEI